MLTLHMSVSRTVPCQESLRPPQDLPCGPLVDSLHVVRTSYSTVFNA